MSIRVNQRRFSISLLLLLPLTGLAAGERTPGQWQFSLAAGSGQTETPLSNRQPVKGHVMPVVSYYGERFYLENSHLGYALLEQDQFYLDLAGELNRDGMFYRFDGVDKFGWWDALGIGGSIESGVENGGHPVQYPADWFQDIKRDLSYMGGLAATWLHDAGQLRLSFLQDISGVHGGQTIRLSAQRDWHWQALAIRLQLGIERNNKTLNTYYYNVRPQELNAVPSYFHTGASLNGYYGITVSYQFHPDWAVLAHWQQYHLDHALMASPLLARASYHSRFIGVRYNF